MADDKDFVTKLTDMEEQAERNGWQVSSVRARTLADKHRQLLVLYNELITHLSICIDGEDEQSAARFAQQAEDALTGLNACESVAGAMGDSVSKAFTAQIESMKQALEREAMRNAG